MLESGLYETLINQDLKRKLEELSNQHSDSQVLDPAESSKILANYVAKVIEQGLNTLLEKGGDGNAQVELINRLVTSIYQETEDTFFQEQKVEEPASQLLSVVDTQNSGFAVDSSLVLERPITSISQSSLFTGAIHEPQMFSELKKEIKSSSQIDMLVSFVKWSGLRLIYEELLEFTQNGGQLRVITTSYMGATDLKAVEELFKLPNTHIKISYDTKRTRLHAKTYIFYRNTGLSTAYVGSSNLSHAAISSGLEWNTKVTEQDLPQVMRKITGTFESYWHEKEFENYHENEKPRLALALNSEKYGDINQETFYTYEIVPFGYQQEILDKLQTEREVRGYYRNLVVAATGTGKTVISAFDYRRFRQNNPQSPCRLLFVAHREEILRQSLHTFRTILKDGNFGNLFVGNHKPDSIDHLFISVQTFCSQDFSAKTTSDFYDFIVVDEFHHAAAPTYQKVLHHYKPTIFIGLTATPERMDGEDILSYFNHRIAAEIRLTEAIDRKLLSPFQYFGVSDSVDLNSLSWKRGGYDKNELSNLYVTSGLVAEKRADLVVNSLKKYVTDMRSTKGLGFCVSVEHAKFMASYFQKVGISSICLWGNSTEEERFSAKRRLVQGELQFIFVVDLYNEGVDIPEVNTILFLRPTESLTVFLQQLGRGLRLSEGKDWVTVLDFIGQAHKKYSFEEKFKVLLSNGRKNFKEEISSGFLSVPKGCYIQLEKQAQDYILRNISNSLSVKSGIISRIATFHEDTGLPLTLGNFLSHYHLDPKTMYKRGTFSRLCVLAKVRENFNEELEETLTKGFLRCAAIDSRRWISFLKTVLTCEKSSFSPCETRMLQMFHFTIWQKSYEECGFSSLLSGIDLLKKSPIFRRELL